VETSALVTPMIDCAATSAAILGDGADAHCIRTSSNSHRTRFGAIREGTSRDDDNLTRWSGAARFLPEQVREMISALT
jgi:hypothetical protein